MVGSKAEEPGESKHAVQAVQPPPTSVKAGEGRTALDAGTAGESLPDHPTSAMTWIAFVRSNSA